MGADEHIVLLSIIDKCISLREGEDATRVCVEIKITEEPFKHLSSLSVYVGKIVISCYDWD
jgi:hypothetical protein